MLHGIEVGPSRERPVGFNGGETKAELSAACSGALKELSGVEIKAPIHHSK